jgi:hypothetical protein
MNGIARSRSQHASAAYMEAGARCASTLASQRIPGAPLRSSPAGTWVSTIVPRSNRRCTAPAGGNHRARSNTRANLDRCGTPVVLDTRDRIRHVSIWGQSTDCWRGARLALRPADSRGGRESGFRVQPHLPPWRAKGLLAPRRHDGPPRRRGLGDHALWPSGSTSGWAPRPARRLPPCGPPWPTASACARPG